jgi:hypothetical protein
MNCLEFRRSALIDPLHPGSEAMEHAARCDQCAQFHRSLCRQEEALYRALSVPVPEGLADRVLLRSRPGLGARAWRVLAALAAVLVLALGLRLWMPDGTSPETLAAGIIDHVRHEPEALSAEQGVPRSTLAYAIARSGGELGDRPLTASYAGRCPLPGGGQGEHIVLKTPQGKVTLILMPDKPVATALRLTKDGLNVSILPAGAGSLALVAESDALVQGAETDLLRAVRWRGSGI